MLDLRKIKRKIIFLGPPSRHRRSIKPLKWYHWIFVPFIIVCIIVTAYDYYKFSSEWACKPFITCNLNHITNNNIDTTYDKMYLLVANDSHEIIYDSFLKSTPLNWKLKSKQTWFNYASYVTTFSIQELGNPSVNLKIVIFASIKHKGSGKRRKKYMHTEAQLFIKNENNGWSPLAHWSDFIRAERKQNIYTIEIILAGKNLRDSLMKITKKC